MMNRAAVRKFLPENVPSNPLSSLSTRSASATPSNIQSSGRGRSPSRTPPIARPSSVSPSPPPIGQVGSSLENPVIEVETSPERDTIPAPSSPSFVPQAKWGPALKKGHVSRRHLRGRRRGCLICARRRTKDDVEFLSGRSMESLGHLILSQTAMTPIVIAMIERFDKMRANLEAALAQLKGGRIQTESLKK
ncbi:hypothetical protein Salat_2441300 [Sesamum alatum]|uniref:Uncharacterized protein n=1 Tax=Sesamum alatum TaxID=300844 RepID=A0AAE1XZ40_9LAMI|nr:hypothetical protein Salat_2441300 [Sesamum alatum]